MMSEIEGYEMVAYTRRAIKRRHELAVIEDAEQSKAETLLNGYIVKLASPGKCWVRSIESRV